MASVGLLAVGAAPGAASTQSLQIQAAPNAQATRPEAITATGQVGVPSTIAIYSQLGGSCAGQVADEAARGGALVDRRTVNPGAFSFTVSFTPTMAGTYYLCTYLDGAAGGTVEHQNQAFTLVVAPAPAPAAPPPPAGVPPAAATPPSPLTSVRTCVVPNLRRHTLRGAQHLLGMAGCKLGVVYRPSARGLAVARRQAGGRTPALVVVSQTPKAGTVHSAGYTVAVRLGFGPAPRINRTKPTP